MTGLDNSIINTILNLNQRSDVSPKGFVALLMVVHDIIYRMMKVFRDYCGVLNEESIRKNFVLIYEIIDEIIDYGHA